MEFKVGDVVELKSHGPHMTVISIDGDTIYCCWFNTQAGAFEYKSHHFPTAALKKVERR